MINQLEKIFTKIILKLRCIKRKYRLCNQFCKHCGREMGYDFIVSDEDWYKLPEKYHNHVLCIHCFCKLYGGDLNKINIKYFK